MNETIRQCYKGIAYCFFHPQDLKKKEVLEKLILEAWNLGYPRIYFDKGNSDIKIEDMTTWEIGYALRYVIDISQYT